MYRQPLHHYKWVCRFWDRSLASPLRLPVFKMRDAIYPHRTRALSGLRRRLCGISRVSGRSRGHISRPSLRSQSRSSLCFYLLLAFGHVWFYMLILFCKRTFSHAWFYMFILFCQRIFDHAWFYMFILFRKRTYDHAWFYMFILFCKRTYDHAWFYMFILFCKRTYDHAWF